MRARFILSDKPFRLRLRVWRSAEAILLVVIASAAIVGISVVEHLEKTGPKIPNAALGQTVAVYWRPTIVYVTPAAAKLVDWTLAVGVVAALMLCALVIWRKVMKIKVY